MWNHARYLCDSSLEIKSGPSDKRIKDRFQRDVRERRCDAGLDIFVTHDKHTLLVTRHKHDPLVRPRVQLDPIKPSAPGHGSQNQAYLIET